MRLNLVLLLFFAALLLLEGCEQVKNVFKKKSPRQKYVEAIKESPLADNQNVQQWIEGGKEALEDPVAISLPFKAKMIFFIDEPGARAWQFELPAGRTFLARVSKTDEEAQVFMSLFTPQNGSFDLLEFAEDSAISYQLDEDQILILRVQPELLTSGSAVLTITGHPSMAFPVKGADLNDIGGVFGDPREGGERQHKGIDIFADRGTPVLAAASGRARTDRGGLGGNKIWLRVNGLSVYYAHLDSFAFQGSKRVRKGQVIGFVGNSGNARTTPPHLHFGIYDNGAVPPLPFVKPSNTETEPITAEPEIYPKWGRVNAAKANVRLLPSTKKPPVTTLGRDIPVKVIGATGGWYRVKLAGVMKGFIYQTLLEPAASPIQTETIAESSTVFNSFAVNHPLFQTDSTRQLEIYGSYQGRQLAKYKGHWVWIRMSKE